VNCSQCSASVGLSGYHCSKCDREFCGSCAGVRQPTGFTRFFCPVCDLQLAPQPPAKARLSLASALRLWLLGSGISPLGLRRDWLDILLDVGLIRIPLLSVPIWAAYFFAPGRGSPVLWLLGGAAVPITLLVLFSIAASGDRRSQSVVVGMGAMIAAGALSFGISELTPTVHALFLMTLVTVVDAIVMAWMPSQ
jgi:hypothetical protein